jgi:uncharacterized protein (TIGR02466 family)
MNDIKIDRTMLWATTLFTVSNPMHEQIAGGLKRHIYGLREKADAEVMSGVAGSIKTNLFESTFDFFSSEVEEVKTLKQFCGQMTMEIVRHVNAAFWSTADQFSLSFQDSWCHVTTDGGFHEWHNHPNCSWCGIYYVDIGDSTPENGANAFYDPRSPSMSYVDHGTRYLEDDLRVRVPPENGTLLIFPSYLYHSGTLYRGERDRLLVSFNARILEGG